MVLILSYTTQGDLFNIIIWKGLIAVWPARDFHDMKDFLTKFQKLNELAPSLQQEVNKIIERTQVNQANDQNSLAGTHVVCNHIMGGNYY